MVSISFAVTINFAAAA